jgi:arabinofuranan 3-O-arabinosyltransferase
MPVPWPGCLVIGALSNEFLPAAMPLDSPPSGCLLWSGGRRGVAAVGWAAAVGLCGAVNANATIAVLIPAALYVLTLGRPAPRWRILAWWCPAVVAATLWWSVPLVLLSHYGVSWLPYTESAAITTSVTGLSQTLRGAANWGLDLVVSGARWQLATGWSLGRCRSCCPGWWPASGWPAWPGPGCRAGVS